MAIIITAPTKTPITTAVIPSTNALILMFLAIFLKEDASVTVKM
jgi:hypothetical protein